MTDEKTIGLEKWIYFLVCFLATFFAGFGSRHGMRLAKEWINATGTTCLSIGIFGSLLLNDFFSDLFTAESNFKKKYCSDKIKQVPFAGACTFLGILIMFVTDMIIHKTNGHSHKADELEKPIKTSTNHHGIVFLLIGVGIHSLLEGIPIGIRDKEKFLTVAASLLVHKCIESTTIASGLTDMNQTTSIIITGVYALMTPVGVVFGAGIASAEPTIYTDFLMMLLIGLSTGLIIFLAFVEMLPKVMVSDELRMLWKCVLIIGGYGFISSVSYALKLVSAEHK